jgi:exopolysaccharide biosynthesis polyprenyl glycosylphosphotransferase
VSVITFPSSSRDEAPARTKGILRLATPRRLVVGMDLAALATAAGSTAIVTSWSPWVLLALSPVWLVSLSVNRCYAARRVTRAIDELRRVGKAGVGASVVIAAAAYLAGATVDRWSALGYAAGTTLALFAGRGVSRVTLKRARRSGVWVRHVLVIGENDEGLQLRNMLDTESWIGYAVVDTIDGDGTRDEVIDRVRSAVEMLGVSGVVIASTALDLSTTNTLIRTLTDDGIHVELSSSLLDVATHRLTVRPLGRFPVVYIEPTVRNGWRAVAKRTFDVAVALAVGLVTAPIWIATAIAVKLDSKGPAIFSQDRLGRHGETFKVHKFRSMVTDAEAKLAELAQFNEADGPLFKMKHDPRITRVGRIIRKLSIDELPQLWNVIKGEMSLVGPRPALAKEAAEWQGRLHERLRVQPGLTGMWQVHGRSSASFDDYERLDLYYVDNWSLTQDLIILARTIPAVLASKGAH